MEGCHADRSGAGGLAVFDLDGTLVQDDTFLRFLLSMLAKRPARWRSVPALALGAASYYARMRDNTWLKSRFLELILGGMETGTLERYAVEYAARLQGRIVGQARETMARHRRAGDALVLATASPDVYVVPLGQALRMDHIVCTRTTFGQGRFFDGRLASANCHGSEKVRLVQEWRNSSGRNQGIVTCYTDHHADWPLLQWADIAVAVNPTRELEARRRRASMGRECWR